MCTSFQGLDDSATIGVPEWETNRHAGQGRGEGGALFTFPSLKFVMLLIISECNKSNISVMVVSEDDDISQ